GLQDAAACVDDRLLGGEDHLGRLLDLLRVAGGGGLVAGEAGDDLGIGGPVPLHGRARVGGVDDVLGDVDEHRAGASRGGDVERLADHAGDLGGLGDQEVVLGHRLGDAGDVGLLEGVGADRGGGDLAGDADHRHRV